MGIRSKSRFRCPSSSRIQTVGRCSLFRNRAAIPHASRETYYFRKLYIVSYQDRRPSPRGAYFCVSCEATDGIEDIRVTSCKRMVLISCFYMSSNIAILGGVAMPLMLMCPI